MGLTKNQRYMCNQWSMFGLILLSVREKDRGGFLGYVAIEPGPEGK